MGAKLTSVLSHIASTTILCIGALEPALACDLPFYEMPANTPESVLRPPIKIKSDCSFEMTGYKVYRGEDGTLLAWDDAGGGDAVFDKGNGRISQRITAWEGCAADEKLLVVDCSTDEAVLIKGRRAPEDRENDFAYSTIENIQPPYGPIEVTGETQITSLARQARVNDIIVIPEVSQFFETATRKQYDHSCGCKLFYPGSPGAGE